MINSFAISDGRENVVSRYQPRLGLNVSIDRMLTRKQTILTQCRQTGLPKMYCLSSFTLKFIKTEWNDNTAVLSGHLAFVSCFLKNGFSTKYNSCPIEWHRFGCRPWLMTNILSKQSQSPRYRYRIPLGAPFSQNSTTHPLMFYIPLWAGFEINSIPPRLRLCPT